ncbi:MAG: FkbM family methyltransferase [Gammaproteobacteria bacterium]|nr:FkbM family methyltransferase [Gammaproteobacteria bacterium]
MKIKNVFQFLGFRGKAKHYGYAIHDVDLGNETIHFARWLHPHHGEAKKTINTQMVDAHRAILKEGDFCIDIGAHMGYSTLPMALAAGNSGCALALEPNPFIYHVLEKNARANNHATNIKTMMAAAATYEGFMKFEYSDAGFCNGGRHENIPAIKHGHPFKQEVFCLDLAKELRENYQEFLPRLKFIKVDAEGYDLYVLKSMHDIINCYKPVIKAEVFKNTDSQYRKELLTFLLGLGYFVYKITNEPLGAGPEITEDNFNKWRHYDVLCIHKSGEIPSLLRCSE